jgi:6-phosphogluconate dehydrogenase
LNLKTVARVWTGGCIIRAALLDKIQSAYGSDPKLANLLMAPSMVEEVQSRQADWRWVIRTGVDTGLPIPGFMSALSYWDAYRSDRLPANLLMAQRDYFGAHTYERVDTEGIFHTRWTNS